jgi:hypothetical protein
MYYDCNLTLEYSRGPRITVLEEIDVRLGGGREKEEFLNPIQNRINSYYFICFDM